MRKRRKNGRTEGGEGFEGEEESRVGLEEYVTQSDGTL